MRVADISMTLVGFLIVVKNNLEFRIDINS